MYASDSLLTVSWCRSETKETFHYLEATNNVPLSTNFKPQVKVLSRNPVIAKRDVSSGMGQLALDDDSDDNNKQKPLSAEEVRAKQKREREEKQRKYDEARAKIFGESAPSSRGSSPGMGTTTPPRGEGRFNQRGGRGRGGGHQTRNNNQSTTNTADSQPFEPRQQGLTPAGQTRELYDPHHSPRNSSTPKREDVNPSPRQQSESVPIRGPRGPDGSGRGGFGFARRGV